MTLEITLININPQAKFQDAAITGTRFFISYKNPFHANLTFDQSQWTVTYGSSYPDSCIFPSYL